MMPAAGDLDRRITIRRRSISYDAHNQPLETWPSVGTVWASWRRATANERLASGQVGSQVTDIFEIYWSPTLAVTDTKDRLTYAGRDYDILEVTELGYREGLLIRATARADA